MCNLENMYSKTRLNSAVYIYIYISESLLISMLCMTFLASFHWPYFHRHSFNDSYIFTKTRPFFHRRSVLSLVASFSTHKATCTCSDPSRYSPFRLSTAEDHWSTLPSAASRVRGTSLPDPISVVWGKFTAFGCIRKIPRSRPF